MSKITWKDVVDNCVKTGYMSYSMSNDSFDGPDEFINYVLDSVIGITHDDNNCSGKNPEDVELKLPTSVVHAPTHRRFYNKKSLSSRFENMLVYIYDGHNGMAPDSLARIKPSTDDSRVSDLYVLESTGEELNMSEYLSKFGVSNNPCRIKFVVNPKVSIWMLKVTHFNILNTPRDIEMFTGGNGDYSYKSCNRRD